MSLIAAATAAINAVSARADDKPETKKIIHVAIYDDAGTPDLSALAADNALKISPSFVTKRVNAKSIREGALKGMDVLVQPGGSGSKQSKTLEPEGLNAIRSFVKDGGGYVGICAGAYLATSGYTWSLHILNADTVDSKHWARGFGPVTLKFSSLGQTVLDEPKDNVICNYHQGPLLAPGHEEGLAPYEPIATFATEIAKNGAPTGVMVGTTAMARGVYGKGHVVAISPHPEKTDGLDNIVRRLVEWAATGEVGNVSAPTTRPVTLQEATASLKKATGRADAEGKMADK
jgi:glutamine amidotransferase PdxT